MPVIEYIDGIECVFPESKEASFAKFSQMVMEALYKGIEDGDIPASVLDDLLHEEGYTDEDIKELERQADEENGE